MDSTYFTRLADRCISAARRSFDLEAVTEFRKLADEFAHKARELERMGVSNKNHVPRRQSTATNV